MQILVLDDSDTMRGIIVKNLMDVGLKENEIYEARNGMEALDLMKEKTFDLMMLDIVMDGIDGISVCKQAKSSQPDTKIVMCSTFSEKSTVKELIDIGIDDFIVKPFSEDRLKDALTRHIKRIEGKIA